MMVIEWTSIAVALIGMVSGWVSWWLDRRRHRQEVEGLKADNRQKEMNLSTEFVGKFKELIAKPLENEVVNLRTEVNRLKDAVEGVNDCAYRDECPVRDRMQQHA